MKRGNRRGLAVHRRARQTGVVTAVLFAGTATAVLGVAFRYHLGVPSILVTVLLGGAAPAALYMTWATYRLSAMQASAQMTSPSLSDVADEFALAVSTQWQTEVQVRRLHDPYPLPVRWEPVNEPLVESWEALVTTASSGLGWPTPPRSATWASGTAELAGMGDELADILERVPTRRMVVLGEPGSGKTILMIRLVLNMLARRASGGPVPVLVSVASWDPTTEDLYDWLEARVRIDYPGLADLTVQDDKGASSFIRELLALSLIVPILDGLDEIPDALRGPAIARINDALRPGQHIIVTCRTEPYREATRPMSGVEVTLHAAAGVELRPLDSETLLAYFRADAGGPAAATKWTHVLAGSGSSRLLVAVLSNPLMAGLARVIYNPRPGEQADNLPDPLELCEIEHEEAIRNHLFDMFVAAAYRSAPSASVHSRWSAKQAEKWLRFLAGHLEENVHGSDLAWWDLTKSVPRSVSSLATGAVTGFAVIFAVEIAFSVLSMVYFGLTHGPMAGLTVAITGLTVAAKVDPLIGLAAALTGVIVTLLTYEGDQRRQAMRSNISSLSLGVSSLAFGLLVGIAMWQQSTPTTAFTAGICAGIVAGIAGIIANRRRVYLDLRKGWLAVAAVGSVAGIAAAVMIYYFGDHQFLIGFGITFGLIAGLSAGIVALITSKGDQRPSLGPRWRIRRGLLVAAVGTVAAGLVGGYTVLPEQRWEYILIIGLPFGLAGAIVAGLDTIPHDLSVALSPRAVLARDRTTTLVLILVTGLAGGLVTGLLIGFLYGQGAVLAGVIAIETGGGPAIGLAVGLGVGLGIGSATAIVFGFAISGFGSAWPQWIVARAWLTLRRRLPKSPMEFLSDAHKRGVLRQTGAVYQFRHIELQRRLAHQHIVPLPPTVETATTGSQSGGPTRLHTIPLRATEALSLITLRWGRQALAAASVVIIFALAVTGSLMLAGIIPPRSASHTPPGEGLKPYSPAIPPISAHSQVRRTKLLTFEPWTQDGLSHSLRVTDTVPGVCWTSSSMAAGRSDAFRCFVDHAMILDPCFASPAEVGFDWFYTRFGKVACPYAGMNRIVIIQLVAPLPPVPEEQSPHRPSIWLITLANGDQCSFITGATTFLRGMRLNYSCLYGGNLYGFPRRSGRIWKIYFRSPDSGRMILVPIAQMVS